MRLTSLLALFCITVILSGCGTPEERAAAHLETAQELFDEGDYINARLEASNAAQIEPKNAAVRYLLALIAEQEQRPRDMWQHLQVAVDEDPELLEARIKLGTLYVFAQAYDQAAEQAAAASALAPDDPDVRVLNARLLLQQGASERGLAVLDEALALEPMHLEALGMKALSLQEDDPDRALGLLDGAIRQLDSDKSWPLRQLRLEILSRHQRTQEFEQALRAMIEDAPDDDSTYQTLLARFYANQGRMDEAEDMLRDLAAAVSEDADARLDVVQFLAEARTPEAAVEALQAFIEADPENQQLKLALGDLYLNNDRRDEAVSIYREAAALDSRSEPGLRARVKLAAERVRNGDMDGAGELTTRILADAPDYSQALLLRAGLLFTTQRYDDAIADLRILLRKEADNQRALLLMARSHIAADDIILGKDIYRRLLELNPAHAVAARELVALMLQDGEDDEVETVLERLAQGASGSVAAAVMKIEMLAQQGDWQAAEVEARRLAARTDPDGTGAFQLGQVLEGQRRYVEAGEAFSQALEKRPDNISMMQGLARSLNAQGKADETLAFLRRRAAENPDHPGIRLMLGGALADRGEVAEAEQIFESVITDQPKLSAAYVAVASLYPDDATKRIAVYRRGLTALPADLTLSGFLVDEYQRLQRTDDLIELYETLLAANPEAPALMNNLAALLADYRDGDPASIEHAVQLVDAIADTDDPLIMDTVGWVYYRDGQYDRAVRYLERAVAAVSELPVMRYHLGMAYLAAGDRVGAKQELEAATQPANANFDGIDEAREALATLR